MVSDPASPPIPGPDDGCPGASLKSPADRTPQPRPRQGRSVLGRRSGPDRPTPGQARAPKTGTPCCGWMAQGLPDTSNWPATRPTRPHPPLPRKTCSSSTSAPPPMRRRSSAWRTRADRSSPDITPTGSTGESLSPTRRLPARPQSPDMAVSSTVPGRQTPTRPRSQPRCRRTEPEKTEQADRRARHSHEIVSTQDTYSASICCRASARALPRHRSGHSEPHPQGAMATGTGCPTQEEG